MHVVNVKLKIKFIIKKIPLEDVEPIEADGAWDIITSDPQTDNDVYDYGGTQLYTGIVRVLPTHESNGYWEGTQINAYSTSGLRSVSLVRTDADVDQVKNQYHVIGKLMLNIVSSDTEVMTTTDFHNPQT